MFRNNGHVHISRHTDMTYDSTSNFFIVLYSPYWNKYPLQFYLQIKAQGHEIRKRIARLACKWLRL